MELQCTHTHTHIQTPTCMHMHPAVKLTQAVLARRTGSCGGGPRRAFHAPLEVAALQHYNPVIITNTLRRLFAGMWAYVPARTRVLRGPVSHLAPAQSIKRQACSLLFNLFQSRTNPPAAAPRAPPDRGCFTSAQQPACRWLNNQIGCGQNNARITVP